MTVDLTPKIRLIPKKEKIQTTPTTEGLGSRVGGLNATPNSIWRGAGNEIFKVDSQGLYMGNADFASAPFRVTMAGAGHFAGTLEAGSIHIPDQTTANSAHTETDGDSYWGCNVANWVSDNDNANAWIKKDGTAKFQSVDITGVVTISSGSGIANLSDAGDLATTNEADANVLNMTNAPAEASATAGATWGSDISNKPTTLGDVNATEGTKLTGISTGADVTQTIIDDGMITTGYITLNTAGHIKSGKTTYADATAGFWLGNDGGTPKFSIGDASTYLKWAGTTLVVKAGTGSSIDFSYVSGATAPAANATVGGTIGTDILDEDDNTPAQGLVVNFDKYTAGEDITEDDVVCVKPSYVDYYCGDDTYGSGSNPGVNYGSETELLIDSDKRCFIKVPTASIPTQEVILRAELRMKRGTFGGSTLDIELQRVTGADWAEGTLTYTNQPATTDDVDDRYCSVKEITTGTNPDWISWDITQLVRQWKAGEMTNYGLRFVRSGGSGTIGFASSETASAVDRPVLRIYRMDTSDGEVYKADNEDFLTCRSIVGIAQETVSEDATIKIQQIGLVTGLPHSETGGTMYLGTGGLTTTSNNGTLERIIQLGKITANTKALLNIQTKDILIEKFPESGVSSALTKFYITQDVRYAVVEISGDTNQMKDLVRLDREEMGCNGFTRRDAGASMPEITFSWGTNYLNVSVSNWTSQFIKNIYFYT